MSTTDKQTLPVVMRTEQMGMSYPKYTRTVTAADVKVGAIFKTQNNDRRFRSPESYEAIRVISIGPKRIKFHWLILKIGNRRYLREIDRNASVDVGIFFDFIKRFKTEVDPSAVILWNPAAEELLARAADPGPQRDEE